MEGTQTETPQTRKPEPEWVARDPCTFSYTYVRAYTIGEARARLKKVLGLRKRDRLPVGFVLRRTPA